MLFMYFFHCLEKKCILHGYRNDDTALIEYKWIHLIWPIFICHQKSAVIGHLSWVTQVYPGSCLWLFLPHHPSILLPLWHLQQCICWWRMQWLTPILFHNFISVKFIESMLHNQQPCTPTCHSNWLATQATGGASSLSRSTTPKIQHCHAGWLQQQA